MIHAIVILDTETVRHAIQYLLRPEVPKMEVLDLIRLFWGWFFPKRIPPFEVPEILGEVVWWFWYPSPSASRIGCMRC